MNPRGVRHPDQTVLQEGSVRIILSLRAVGEGHISTIAFREGTISPGREWTLAPQPTFATTAMLGVHQVGNQVDRISVHCDPDSSISGTVIFPITEADRNGLEDLRLVEFERGSGKSEWIGTYTASLGSDLHPYMPRSPVFRELIGTGAGR